ncbi:MAG: Ca2+-binding EF-hand superfamily protein [Planctomycetota bacterium]|jgi:Ca2+-binding EF-hand superfamily protein
MNLLRALAAVTFLVPALSLLSFGPVHGQGIPAGSQASAYAKQLELHGVSIQATSGVDDEYLYIAAMVYEHMTSRSVPYDLRELHRQSGFRILLLTEDEKFGDLPDYPDDDDELEQAGGLGGSIGEFYIGVRVGSPHTLVHELGHGIYHSAIQFQETGGARDEEGWYEERVESELGLGLDEAVEKYGEEEIHEVLLAPAGTFSADLAVAWRNAVANGLWEDEYAGSEPNEYWAEGVAFWFRAYETDADDPRAYLAERDPMLHALCATIFPDTNWTPADAKTSGDAGVHFSDDSEARWQLGDPVRFDDVFSALDRDGNGELNPFEAAEAMLMIGAEADQDSDGVLAQSEWRSFFEERLRGDVEERIEVFEQFDFDGDGRLMLDQMPGELRAYASAADENGDGVLTLEELLAADLPDDGSFMLEGEVDDFLSEVDHDGDGSFELNDLPEPQRTEYTEDFREMDLDQDGFVTREELLELFRFEMEGAQFAVEGNVAVMTGVIGASTPGRVLELLLMHPNVDTIVMENVPGSMDDESNLRAAMMVYRAGLATHVPSGGEVASGGTDFFLAGKVRTAAPDALFGVHSWSGIEGDGADVPRDDPEHQKYLDFYRSVSIPAQFYWYTLEAAPADDIHWMTSSELVRYQVLTSKVPGESGEREYRGVDDD